jgi:hypothetical protein
LCNPDFKPADGRGAEAVVELRGLNDRSGCADALNIAILAISRA